MTGRFVSTRCLAAAGLTTDTPVGLFRPLGNSPRAGLLWVVEYDGERHAIVLVSNEEAMRFHAWELPAGPDRNWEGLALGPVELLVDVERFDLGNPARLLPGRIGIWDGGAHIGVALQGMNTAVIRVADCAEGGEGAMSFRRWQLVQRDHQGAPIVLFEKTE